MRKIYFEKRCIVICTPSDEALSDPNAVEFHLGEPFDIHDLVRMFEVQDTLARIYIPTESPERTYRRVCAEFKDKKGNVTIDFSSIDPEKLDGLENAWVIRIRDYQ